MGNSKSKTIKKQGGRLGSGDVSSNQRPSRAEIASKYQRGDKIDALVSKRRQEKCSANPEPAGASASTTTTATTASTTTTGNVLSGNRLTREEIAAKYEQGDKIDALIRKNRIEKEKERAEASKRLQEVGNNPKPTNQTSLSSGPPAELMDPLLQHKLEQDKIQLEQSNFDVYGATFAAAGNARNVIAMDGFTNDKSINPQNGTSSSNNDAECDSSDANVDAGVKSNHIAAASDAKDNTVIYSSTEDTQQTIVIFRSAMESGELDRLLGAENYYQQQPNNVKSNPEVQQLLGELLQLRDSMIASLSTEETSASTEEDNVNNTTISCMDASDITSGLQLDNLKSIVSGIVATTIDNGSESCTSQNVETLKTIRKLLSNVLDNPQEEKFRTIKLSNKAIQKKIVSNPTGDGLKVLQFAGFAINEDCLVVDDNIVQQLEAQSQEVLSLFDNSIAAISVEK